MTYAEFLSTRQNVSEHVVEGIPFEVYQLDSGWFWSFMPHWRDPGPFATEAEAVTAGYAGRDEAGQDYFR